MNWQKGWSDKVHYHIYMHIFHMVMGVVVPYSFKLATAMIYYYCSKMNSMHRQVWNQIIVFVKDEIHFPCSFPSGAKQFQCFHIKYPLGNKTANTNKEDKQKKMVMSVFFFSLTVINNLCLSFSLSLIVVYFCPLCEY